MSVFRSSVIVSLCTFVSRIFGFVRDILVANSLGTSNLADVFNVAFRLPNFFRRLVAEGAFNAAFIPQISSKIEQDLLDEDLKMLKSKNFASQVFTILSMFLMVLVIVMEIFMPFCISIFAPGFENDPEKFELTILLSRITMPYLFFIALVSFYGAVLNSLGFFIASSAVSILLNFTLIFSIIFLESLTETVAHALSFGILFSGILQFTVMFLVIRKEECLPKFNAKFLFKKNPIHPDVKKMFKNMLPAIFSSGIMQVNLWVDTIFASLIAGALSILTYADRVMQLPLALIGTAIGTVLLPAISRHIKANHATKANHLQNRAIEAAAALTIPASMALIVAANPIIAILFQRGEFSASDSQSTAAALAIFALGLPAFVASKILIPNFFANYDTKTPMKISIMCLVVNALFCVILTPIVGFTGIAMATVISGWLAAAVAFTILKKKSMIEIDTKCQKRLLKIFIASSIMSVFLVIFQFVVQNNFSNLLLFIMFIGSGFGVYVYLIYRMKIFKFEKIVKKLSSKI